MSDESKSLIIGPRSFEYVRQYSLSMVSAWERDSTSSILLFSLEMRLGIAFNQSLE